MRILLIEDDDAAARGMTLALSCDNFTVQTCELGADGIAAARRSEYDAIILDLQLPDMNGLEVLKVLRAGKIHTPVLVLSGDATLEARIKSLTGGADDYMTKPFNKDELAARLRAIMRRARTHDPSLITTGKVVVNLDAKTVEAAGSRVDLTIKEYQLLECLSLRKGITLTKEVLLNYLYDGMDEPPQKIIDVFVCKVRKKLAAAMGGGNYIKTVWGRGYELCDPPADDARAA